MKKEREKNMFGMGWKRIIKKKYCFVCYVFFNGNEREYIR